MSSSSVINVTAVRRAWPFWMASLLAMVAGGLISGVLAHEPSRQVMWLVAYLVLVVGVAQTVLAAGQVTLAASPAPTSLLASEWISFNGANALVIGGTLWSRPAWVSLGALLFAAALGLFLYALRGAIGRWPVWLYRLLVALLACSALVGVALSLWRANA